VRLEHGLAAGGLSFAAGLGLLIEVVASWAVSGFGELHQLYVTVLALTLAGLGTQVVFGSFFLSILPLGRQTRRWT
jgi:hypothetical protein